MRGEELLQKWKKRAAIYQQNIDQAGAQVIATAKKYDKTAAGTLGVSDVGDALADLGVSLSPAALEEVVAGMPRMRDATQVSVNSLQVIFFCGR